MSGTPFGWLARARYELRRAWLAYLVGGLCLAFLLALWPRYAAFIAAEGEPTVATIVGFAPHFGKGLGGVTVYARSRNGLEGYIHIPLKEVARCRAGDQIAASVVDGGLRLEPAPCTTHGTIGASPSR